MARLFNDGNNEYLEIDQAVVTVPPFAMACGFYSDDATIVQALMALVDKDAADEYHVLRIRGDVAGDPVSALSRTGAGGDDAKTSSGYSANTWHHACGIWAAATDRRVFIDGGSKGTDANNRAPAGIDRTSIGRLGDSSPALYMSGRLAEAAIWDLSTWPGATDILKADAWEASVLPALAAGRLPCEYQLGLVGYWPVWGLHSPEIDCATGVYPMTLFNGPIQANHAPVVPFMSQTWAASVGALAMPVPVLMRYYRNMRET